MSKKFQYILKRFLYYFYGEKFFKRLPYDWSKHPTRIRIIQEVINLKKYKPKIICIEINSYSISDVKNSDIYKYLIKNNFELIKSFVNSHIFKMKI